MEDNNVKPTEAVTGNLESSEVPTSTPPTSASVPSSPPPTGRKKLFGKISLVPAIVIVIVVLLAGSAAAYFGFVIPNKPENVWKTALNNTARGYDKLIEYTEEQKDVEGGKVKGTFKVDSQAFVLDGNIDGKYDKKTSDINIDAGAAGTRLNFNVLTNIPEGATTPDIYLKAEGLSGLAGLLGAGDPAAAQMLAGLEGQYFFIDHTLIDQMTKMAQQGTSSVPEITQEDVVVIAEAVGKVNKEYLFTTDENKAVLDVKSQIGKETIDGREQYHYKVAFDKPHLKEYLGKLKEALKETKLKDLIKDEDFDEVIKSVDDINDEETADVWVDMKTKLIRTVRFTDSDDASTYVDLGLLYEGGDDYPFYLKFHSDEERNKSEFTIKLTVNMESNVATFNLDGNMEQNSETVKIGANIAFEPSDETVEFNKPENAKSLGELFGPLLGGGLESGFDNPGTDTLGAFDF